MKLMIVLPLLLSVTAADPLYQGLAFAPYGGAALGYPYAYAAGNMAYRVPLISPLLRATGPVPVVPSVRVLPVPSLKVVSAPAPAVKVQPAPAVKALPAPVPAVKSLPAPAEKALPAPASAVKAMPALTPAVKTLPSLAPAVKPLPAPVPAVKSLPAPAEKALPALTPAVKTLPAPAPAVKPIPAPVPAVKSLSAPSPAEKALPSPAPAVKALPAPAPAMKTLPGVSAKDTLITPSIVSSQYHAQDEAGNYNFGYDNINSARMESGNSETVVTGSFTDKSQGTSVKFISDSQGFRQV